MYRKALEQKTKRAMEDGEFLAEWLNRFRADDFRVPWDRVWNRYQRHPELRYNFQKTARRILGKSTISDSDAFDPRQRGFLVRAFLEETFVFWLCVFCLNVEVARQEMEKVGEKFGYRLPDLGNAETWTGFLRVVREHLLDAERWIQSGEIRFCPGDRGFDFDAALRPGGEGRVVLEFVPMNEKSRAILAVANLIGSGNIGRVRQCRACYRFIFAWPRSHKIFCSHRCQTAYWQRTPEGLKYKRAQMKTVRASEKGFEKQSNRAEHVKGAGGFTLL